MKTLIIRKKEGSSQTRGMKRSLLSVMYIIAFSCACFAQDVIVTKDSRKIEAKLTEINIEHVKYRMFNHQDGPVYTLPKSDIVTIIYQNGTVETFVSETPSAQKTQSSAQAAPAATQPAPVATTPRAASVSANRAAKNKQAVGFGVKGGLNLASEMNDDGSTDSRAGIHIGAFLSCQLGNKVDFQPELLFSMQGSKYTLKSTECIEKLDYINVPLMFKIYVNKTRSLSIDVGPQFGYMVNAKLSSGGIALDLFDVINDINRFDASIGLGLSYLFNSGLDIYFRGTGGLTKIAESKEHKNSVFQLGIGYRF